MRAGLSSCNYNCVSLFKFTEVLRFCILLDDHPSVRLVSTRVRPKNRPSRAKG